MSEQEFDRARRGFLRKAAYIAPLVATISVMPSIAAAGSCNNGVGDGADCLPPGLQKNGKGYLDNDDVWGTPGNPQNQGGPK